MGNRKHLHRGIGTMARRWAAAVALGVGVGLGAIGGGAIGGAGTASAADILRIGTTQPIDSLNPFISQSDYSSIAYAYVYPFLVQYDGSLNIQPYFATKWETSADGKVWTYHTVPGATWSDGQPMTAKDAAFTMNMMKKFKDDATALLAGYVDHMDKAEAPDDNTLVVTYSAPVNTVLALMQQMPILPEHIWAPLTEGKGEKITSFQNEAPIVSGGPFMLVKHVKDQLAIFKRNPKWWGKAPVIDGFGLQFFANDDAMITALTTGQLDMIGEQTPPTAVATLTKAKMTVSSAPGVGIKTFIINTNPKKKKNLELLDPKVREAMEYAIDRDTIVKTVWLGHATPGSSVVSPASGFKDEAIKALPYDTDKGNALLDAAGYKKGPNGIRVANGHSMAYDVVFPTEENGTGDRTFQIIKAGFKKIGIEIRQRKMDPDAATAAIRANDNKYDEFDLAMWNWVLPVEPGYILGVMTCDQYGNNSDSGYCDPAYDALFKKQSTMIDPQQRREVLDQLQKKLFDDRPYIVLVYPDVLEAHNPKWDGFVMSPLVGSVTNLSTVTLMNVHRAK